MLKLHVRREQVRHSTGLRIQIGLYVRTIAEHFYPDADDCASQSVRICMYVVYVYQCKFIHHTLISMSSLVAHAYRHDMHTVTLT